MMQGRISKRNLNRLIMSKQQEEDDEDEDEDNTRSHEQNNISPFKFEKSSSSLSSDRNQVLESSYSSDSYGN